MNDTKSTFLKYLAIILVLALSNSHVNAFYGLRRPILLDPPDSVEIRAILTKWFQQKLDHFNPTDTRTWRQRYYVNEAYYNDSSKNNIYLMIGGEAEANSRWVNYGAWMETAEQYGGLLLYLEHRFYGQSQPLSDLSTENLKYLSTHQALEDIANFIQGINKEYNLDTTKAKWIVFGGSYAGTLAAWVRQKFPHLVTGAMSSSGPLEAILDFDEYLEVVIRGLATHSQACINTIKAAYTDLDQLVSSCLEDTEIYTELNTAFNLCDTIEFSEENDKDLATLFEVLTDNNFAALVQYHGTPGVEVTVNEVCDILVNETSDEAEIYRLAKVNSLMSSKCTDYKYDRILESWRDTTASPNSIMRQWVYQTCTEFGFFQTSNQANPIFGSRFDISFFTGLCEDLFGPEFNETMISLGIQATNTRYGGKNISTSNIVYVNGNFDPWHVLSKLESSDDGHKVIVVDGVSHCANMYPQQETDSQELLQARREVNSLIGQWLGVNNNDNNNDNNESNGGDKTSSSIVVLSSIVIWICMLFIV